jgi:hypothetical protein
MCDRRNADRLSDEEERHRQALLLEQVSKIFEGETVMNTFLALSNLLNIAIDRMTVDSGSRDRLAEEVYRFLMDGGRPTKQ